MNLFFFFSWSLATSCENKTPAALPGAWKMIFNCRSCDSAGFEMTSNLLKLWKDGCFFFWGGEGYVMGVSKNSGTPKWMVQNGKPH